MVVFTGQYPVKQILPEGHRAFWLHLNWELNECSVLAGSMSMAQMLQNLFGETIVPNDADFWYPDVDTGGLEEEDLLKTIGKKIV